MKKLDKAILMLQYQVDTWELALQKETAQSDPLNYSCLIASLCDARNNIVTIQEAKRIIERLEKYNTLFQKEAS